MNPDIESNARTAITVDVLVVGAGAAGVAAAVAASEEGAKTLLVEASGAVGGTISGQFLAQSAGFFDAHGDQVIAGFGQRLVDRLVHEGALQEHVRDNAAPPVTPPSQDHGELSLVEGQFLAEAGVCVWLQSRLVVVRQHAQGLTRCVLETRTGQRTVFCRTVVDASGDAIAAQLVGAQVHNDVTGESPPPSVLFKLNGVDFDSLLAYARANPDDFVASCRFGNAQASEINLCGFGSLLKTAYATGELSLEHRDVHATGRPHRGELAVNVTPNASGAEGLNWTGAAYLRLAQQTIEFARWCRRRVPGCANAYVAAVGDHVGIRESARIVGLYTLTAYDVFSGARFDDRIARGAHPITVHTADRQDFMHAQRCDVNFDIPYRALIVDGMKNFFVAGRCLSSSHEANGSLCITATCFATGEAVGVAAAMAARHNHSAACVSISDLQARLRARGALIRDEIAA